MTGTVKGSAVEDAVGRGTRRREADGLRRLFRHRLPWWSRLLIGLAAVVLGLWLILQPLTSLTVFITVLGVALIVNGVAEAVRPRSGWPSILLGAALGFTGAAVLLFREFSTRTLALIVAVALIVLGAAGIVLVLRRRGIEERVANLLLALAAIAGGATALAWPDVTLLVTAIAFGGYTIVLGSQLVIAELRERRLVLQWTRPPGAHGAGSAPHPQPLRRARMARLTRLGSAVAVLLVVAALGATSARLHSNAPSAEELDFYAAPAIVPDQPGVLIRAEEFTRTVPEAAQAWRILYTTTRDDDRPAIASAIVIVPGEADSAVPVVAWAHGTTGYARSCAPSLLSEPFTSGSLFIADQVIDRGWALVATDYIGLGTDGPHTYLIGEGEGRATLDAVRAARALTSVNLSEQTIVWGHSQGGHAALWAGGIAEDYAPELDLLGVAALAPASDLEGLVGNLDEVTDSIVFSAFTLSAYDAEYDDVRIGDYVHASAQTLLDELSTRCLAEPRTVVSALESLAIGGTAKAFSTSLTTGPLLQRLYENTPTRPIHAPLLIAQGLDDELVLPEVQRAYVEQRCADGQQLEYLPIADHGHVSLVEADSPLVPSLLDWTEARIAGQPSPTSCLGIG